MCDNFWVIVSLALSIFSLVVNLWIQYTTKKNSVWSEWTMINGEWTRIDKEGNKWTFKVG